MTLSIVLLYAVALLVAVHLLEELAKSSLCNVCASMQPQNAPSQCEQCSLLIALKDDWALHAMTLAKVVSGLTIGIVVSKGILGGKRRNHPTKVRRSDIRWFWKNVQECKTNRVTPNCHDKIGNSSSKNL